MNSQEIIAIIIAIWARLNVQPHLYKINNKPSFSEIIAPLLISGELLVRPKNRPVSVAANHWQEIRP